MGNPFAKPKVTPVVKPDPLPPAPERTDTETQVLADEQRKRYASGGGRASTFLSGGGVSQGSSAVRFLGGASAT